MFLLLQHLYNLPKVRCLGPEVVGAYFSLRASKIDQFNEQVKLKVVIVNF